MITGGYFVGRDGSGIYWRVIGDCVYLSEKQANGATATRRLEWPRRPWFSRLSHDIAAGLALDADHTTETIRTMCLENACNEIRAPAKDFHRLHLADGHLVRLKTAVIRLSRKHSFSTTVIAAYRKVGFSIEHLYSEIKEGNKNLAIANRSRVSCAHNTPRASIGINITPWPWNLG